MCSEAGEDPGEARGVVGAAPASQMLGQTQKNPVYTSCRYARSCSIDEQVRVDRQYEKRRRRDGRHMEGDVAPVAH